MCFFGSLLLIAPPLLLILISIVLVISFSVLYIMKRVVKLNKDEIANEKGSLIPLALTTWGFNVLSLAIALIVMDIISFTVPFLDRIHSEWGIAFANAYVPAIIYVAALILLYAALLILFNHFVFKKKITNKPKRMKIICSIVVSSALIWAFIVSFILGLLH